MNKKYEEFRAKAYSALRSLAKESTEFADAQMIIGSADTTASLKKHTIRKKIDTEWIERIEAALPSIDLIVRNPSVAIEDVEEILPVELTRRISEKTIKHLAQHTNYILSVKDDEVIPSKLLNVFREETLLTYENKFVNTLLVRLAAFVDKRYKALLGGSGTEENFKFDYETEFEHFISDESGRNTARINLSIELTSPLNEGISELDHDINAKYADALERIKKINLAIVGFMSSPFSAKLGRNFIRPPVIRTNAILKNKNLKECLNLWEYIEGCDKVGYSFVGDETLEMPSDMFVSDLYSSVALQYTQFYNGVIEGEEDSKIIARNNLFETLPEFDTDINEEEIDDYLVYDSEYRKTVPVSRLMNNRKKLSEDEKRIREAIVIALRADDILCAELIAREEDERRLERERRAKEEEERRAREEAERQRREEEERTRAEEEAARRLAEEEAAALEGKLPVEIRYKRSFMSRYIQADETLQNYYTEIKNTLLSYKGVKARTSFRCETYKHRKQILAKINVMGKALYVYLALTPSEYEDKNCISIIDKPAFKDTPVLVKVKSDRSFSQAMRLIEIMMREQGITSGELQSEDYRLPYEDDDALIDKGLIKVILPNGTVLGEGDETVKANLSELLKDIRKELEEKKVSEHSDEPAEPVTDVALAETEEVSSDITETDGEPIESIELTLTEDTAFPVEIRYKRSFMSRYIQADETLQNYYTEIKNTLLSYKGVKARTSFKCETYKHRKQILAKINVMGKALYVYLALTPSEYEDKNCISIIDKPAFKDTPVLVKVKSDRSFSQAMRLIDIMMNEQGLLKGETPCADYRLPYEDDDALIGKGLIKVMLPSGVVLGEGDETVKANLSEMLEPMRRTPTEKTDLTDDLVTDVAFAETEEVSSDITETDGEPIESIELTLTEDTAFPVEIRYKRSFMSRYIQADESLQNYYTEIKNTLLSYKGVKARTSFRCETYKEHKRILAKINVMGKALYLYLALTPSEYEGRNCISIVDKPAFKDTPVLVKVKSDRSFSQAMRLINDVMLGCEMISENPEKANYCLPYEDDETLIKRGLIKLMLPKGAVLNDGDEIVKADICEVFDSLKKN